MKSLLAIFLDKAKVLGLGSEDLENAMEFLQHHEFELCFDTVITQMREYDIGIDGEFYDLINEIGNRLKLPEESFSFMKELVKL